MDLLSRQRLDAESHQELGLSCNFFCSKYGVILMSLIRWMQISSLHINRMLVCKRYFFGFCRFANWHLQNFTPWFAMLMLYTTEFFCAIKSLKLTFWKSMPLWL